MTKNIDVSWVAVDWGTSNLRAYLMGSDGAVLAELQSDQGMGSLTPDAFEPVLLDLLADYLPENGALPVLCCGMVGARQGWQEAPYTTTPCKAAGAAQPVVAPTVDPRLSVRILPGVSQASPADVMRGEETQIAGFLARFPKFDGVLCLPGTHSKWVRISAEEIVSFQTFMTGELFDLLTQHSVLRHAFTTDAMDLAAFRDAVDSAMSRPQAIASRLFAIRAEGLLNNQEPEVARGQLSGYLLGMELAAARPYWLGMDVAIIGAPALSGLYQEALSAQGCPARLQDAAGLTVAGLKAAYETLGVSS